MGQPLTFLINLDRSTDRLADSTAVLKDASLAFKRVPAVDGSTLDPTIGRAAKASHGRALNLGEVGCFLSHKACAERLLSSSEPYGLVMEDDVALRPDGKQQLEHLWTQLEDLKDWDLINVGRNTKRYSTAIDVDLWNPLGTQLQRAHYFPTTTTAILWSRVGAETFLSLSETITMPVDHFLRHWACKTGRGLGFSRSPLTVRGEPSEIDKMQSGHNARGDTRGLRYYLTRARRQVSNHLNARKSQRTWP